MLAGRGASRDEDIVALRIPGELQEGIGRGEISLIERARAGDDRAFEALIQRHKEKAYISIYKITRHREDTEDALQNAILKVYTHLAGFQGRSQFGTWFIAIAINQALMCLRKRHAQQSRSLMCTEETEEFLLPNLPDKRPDAEGEIQQLELAYAIQCATRRLPQLLRVAFRKRFVDEMSTDETAEELNLSAAAVKSRILRAKLHLRRELGKYWTSSSGNV
jgi:RNA polymerase sigma-70 factor, ECF subfamily